MSTVQTRPPRATDGAGRADDARRAGRAVAGRLTSLDWARGWMVLTNLVVVSFLPPSPEQLQHATWLGVTVFDLVFPLFVGLSGCGLAFAYARRVDGWVTLRRAVVLITAGLAYGAIVQRTTDLSELRFAGPLQVYGVLVVVIALLHLVLRRVRAWTLTTVIVAVVWTATFWTYHRQCPTGAPTRSCNLSEAVDLRLIPTGNLYRQGALGHDPEGLVAIVGCLLTMLVGVTAGKILLARKSPSVTVTHLITWGGTALVLGLVAMQVVEPFKRLWTPSFALLTAVIVVIMLVLGYLLHDHPAPPWWATRRDALAQPFVALGRNALVIYFGSHLVVHELIVLGDPTSSSRIRAVSLPWGGDPRIAFAVTFVLAWWLLAWLLHRRRIYIHA